MTVPNLPTDNLYKFAAIGGLVTALVGVILPMSKSLEYRDTLMKRAIEGKQAAISARHALEDAREANAELEAIRKRQEEGKQPPKGEMSRLQEKNKEYLKLVRQSEIKEAESEITGHVANTTDSMLDDYHHIGAVLYYIGGFCFLSGLLLWYTRVQRYQDRALRAEATNKEREANKRGEG